MKPVAAGAPVVAVHFLGDRAVFALGEETLLFVAPDGAEQRVAVHARRHSGGRVSDGERILTGGDDGKVVATNAKGESETLATDAKHRWIDRVALGPDGAVAWSAGKQAFVRNAKGEVKSLDLPSTAGGLAFSPKGLRLAVAHYGGVSLWFPNAQAAPEMFAWKGSHLDVMFSPDGRFLVTAMQEPTLHGWRLADAKDMRMSGYSAKVRSMAWTADGKWLATSGSEQLIMWPFGSKDGPMGKQPRMLAPYDKRAVAVACHPNAGDRRGRLRGRADHALPHRGRRGDSGEEARRGAGLGARLERGRLEARVRDGRWRGGSRGSGVTLFDPVFTLKVRDAGKFPQIRRDDDMSSPQRLSRNQIVVRSNRLALAPERGTNLRAHYGIFILKWQNQEWPQECVERTRILLGPRAFEHTILKFKQCDRRDRQHLTSRDRVRDSLSHADRPPIDGGHADVGVEEIAQSKSMSRSCIGGCSRPSGKIGSPR